MCEECKYREEVIKDLLFKFVEIKMNNKKDRGVNTVFSPDIFANAIQEDKVERR